MRPDNLLLRLSALRAARPPRLSWPIPTSLALLFGCLLPARLSAARRLLPLWRVRIAAACTLALFLLVYCGTPCTTRTALHWFRNSGSVPPLSSPTARLRWFLPTVPAQRPLVQPFICAVDLRCLACCATLALVVGVAVGPRHLFARPPLWLPSCVFDLGPGGRRRLPLPVTLVDPGSLTGSRARTALAARSAVRRDARLLCVPSSPSGSGVLTTGGTCRLPPHGSPPR